MLELPEIGRPDFEDTLARLKSRIPALTTEWSNLTENSVGIALLELLTYLALEQRSNMNKISADAITYLGRLYGFEPHTSAAASATACFSHCISLCKGTKLHTEGHVFELTHNAVYDGNKAVRYGSINGKSNLISTADVGERAPSVMMFSDSDDFVIGFAQPLPSDEDINITLVFDAQSRTLPDDMDDFDTGSEITWQFYSNGSWRDAELVSDGTFNCFRTGETVLRLNRTHTELDGVYPIRAVVKKRGFDKLPLITGAYLSCVQLMQTDTKCTSVKFSHESFAENKMVFSHALAESGIYRLFVKTAAGYCAAEDMDIAYDVVNENGEYRLATSSRTALLDLFARDDIYDDALMLVLYEKEYVHDFTVYRCENCSNSKIMLNFSGVIGSACKLMIKEDRDGALWQEWNYTEKLHTCSSSDKVFAIDEQLGCIVFGDDIHGAVPHGKLILTSLVLTDGESGNIADNRSAENGIRIINAHGGTNHESTEHFFRRILTEKTEHTLLTEQDFISAAMDVKGLFIKSAEVFDSGNNSITLLIEPECELYGRNHNALDWYTENIRKALSRACLITTKLRVVFPEYIPICVRMTVNAAPATADVRDDIISFVKIYFAQRSAGTVDYAELLKAVSALKCVDSVSSLKMTIYPNEGVSHTSITATSGSRLYLKSADIN